MATRRQHDPKQILLFEDVVKNGDTFSVIPRKPLQEIDAAEAAKLLNVCRTSLSLIVDSPLGQKYLRWRWLTDRQGKRVYELDSVIAYREATKNLPDRRRHRGPGSRIGKSTEEKQANGPK